MPPTPVSTRSSSIPHMQPTIAPFIPQSTSPAPSSDSGTSSTTWAAVGRNGANSKTFNIASKKAPTRKHVLLNVHDERLDSELPRTDPGAEKRFADRLKAKGKLCNNFHLTGNCKCIPSFPISTEVYILYGKNQALTLYPQARPESIATITTENDCHQASSLYSSTKLDLVLALNETCVEISTAPSDTTVSSASLAG